MPDSTGEQTPVSSTPLPQGGPAPRAARSRRLVIALALLALVVVLGLGWNAWRAAPAYGPLDGELTVGISWPIVGKDTYLIGDPKALPVQPGQWMTLQVRLNQPAYVYLVWLDAEGRVVPLYPWNQDELDVKDANQPPPARRQTNSIVNPTLGLGWKFGTRGGLESVLLLARRTPLGEDVRLGAVFDSLPPTPVRNPNEAAVLALDRGKPAASTLLALHRGTEEEARQADQPLLARLAKLQDQFELIRVVRFAHAGD